MDTKLVTRRRVLTIVGATAALPLLGRLAAAEAAAFHTWEGVVLGADARMSLWHADAAKAQRAIQAGLAEIERLEAIFSLSRGDSELSRLNRDGVLADPSPELSLVLNESQRLGELSGGSFDVTVQPLWLLYAGHFRRDPGARVGPAAHDIETARALVDYRAIDMAPRRIAFARPGMGVTLNGIAQGYITDRIADMLRDMGFSQVVAELGEIRVLGQHPDGRPWRVGIKDPREPLRIARTLDAVDRAIATSGGYATPFDTHGKHHHIFDPATGESALRYLDVTIVTDRAMIADALSTAAYVMAREPAGKLLTAFPSTNATFTLPNGKLNELTA